MKSGKAISIILSVVLTISGVSYYYTSSGSNLRGRDLQLGNKTYVINCLGSNSYVTNMMNRNPSWLLMNYTNGTNITIANHSGLNRVYFLTDYYINKTCNFSGISVFNTESIVLDSLVVDTGAGNNTTFYSSNSRISTNQVSMNNVKNIMINNLLFIQNKIYQQFQFGMFDNLTIKDTTFQQVKNNGNLINIFRGRTLHFNNLCLNYTQARYNPLFISNVSNVAITNSIVQLNKGNFSGTTFIQYCNNVSISYTYFVMNSGSNAAALQILLANNVSLFRNNFLANNVSNSTGSVSLGYIGSVDIQKCNFTNQRAKTIGALNVYNVNYTRINGSIFVGNNATNGSTGAASFQNISRLQLINNNVTNNSAVNFTYYLKRYVYNYTNNPDTIISARNTTTAGAFSIDNVSFVEVNNNTFKSNIAILSGALQIKNAKRTLIQRNQFINNSAEVGGAVSLIRNRNLNFIGNKVQGNKAQFGGGLYVSYSRGYLIKNLFLNNVARNGTADILQERSHLIINEEIDTLAMKIHN